MSIHNDEQLSLAALYANFYTRLNEAAIHFYKTDSDIVGDGRTLYDLLEQLDGWEREVEFRYSNGRNVLDEIESLDTPLAAEIQDHLNYLCKIMENVELKSKRRTATPHDGFSIPHSKAVQALQDTVIVFCRTTGVNNFTARRRAEAAASHSSNPSSSDTSPALSRTSPTASLPPPPTSGASSTAATPQRRSISVKMETGSDPIVIDSPPRRDSPVPAPLSRPKTESVQLSYHAFVDTPNHPAVHASPASSYAYSPTSTLQDTPSTYPRTLSPTTPMSIGYRSLQDHQEDHDPPGEEWGHTALNPPVASPSSPAQFRTLEPPVVSQQQQSHRGLTSLEQYRQPSTFPEAPQHWLSNQPPSSPASGP